MVSAFVSLSGLLTERAAVPVDAWALEVVNSQPQHYIKTLKYIFVNVAASYLFCYTSQQMRKKEQRSVRFKMTSFEVCPL